MLKAINTPKRLKQRFPHLANFHAYQVELDKKTIKTWLKSALAVGQLDSNNTIFNSTFEQMANIIDDIYTSGINDANEIRDLGVIRVRVLVLGTDTPIMCLLCIK